MLRAARLLGFTALGLLAATLALLTVAGALTTELFADGIDGDVLAMLEQAERRVRRWDEIVAGAVAEGLDVPAIAGRLESLTHDDYVAEGFSTEVIEAAEGRTEYESEAAGLYRAHTHS